MKQSTQKLLAIIQRGWGGVGGFALASAAFHVSVISWVGLGAASPVALAKQFEEEGGFTEHLYRFRTARQQPLPET
jgi:hypothetical protein